MEGNAKIISLINRDENLHLSFSQQILTLWRNEPSEGFQHIVEKCEPIVIQMFKDAAEEEMEWAEYLFKDGSMLGLNAEILTMYMKWLTNKRMKAIKLEPLFEGAKNPINWINNWTESKSVQNAPQETEIESYVVGSFEQDMDTDNFDDFGDL
jgi:ribonucleoside-diphosphate reductase beta chain